MPEYWRSIAVGGLGAGADHLARTDNGTGDKPGCLCCDGCGVRCGGGIVGKQGGPELVVAGPVLLDQLAREGQLPAAEAGDQGREEQLHRRMKVPSQAVRSGRHACEGGEMVGSTEIGVIDGLSLG